MQYFKIISILSLQLIIFFKSSDASSSLILPHVKCSLVDAECLTKQAQASVPALVEGIPSLGIKQLKKFHIESVKNTWGNFTYLFDNITIEGLKNTTIDSVSINIPLKIMRIEFHATLLMESDWEADGFAFTVAHVTGTGRANIILTNMHVEMLMPFDIIKDEQGLDFVHLRAHFYGFDVEQVHFEFGHIFKDDKDDKKGKMFHKFINMSWRTVLRNFSSDFNGKLTGKIFETIQAYLRSNPLQELALY